MGVAFMPPFGGFNRFFCVWDNLSCVFWYIFKNMRISLAIVFFLASLVVEAPAAYVAVLETISDEKAKDSVSLSDRQFLTNVLREQAVKELPATQNYTIMTRENIQQMLPPGVSIEACEGSCIVETGKNIAADYICQARVGVFGGMLSLSAELYETAKNKLIASFYGRGANVNELLEIIEQKSPDFFSSVKMLAEPATTDTTKPVVEDAKTEDPKPTEVKLAETVEMPKDNAVAKTGESVLTNVEVNGNGAGRWVFLGIGVAAAVTGGILTYLGNKKAKDAAEKTEDSFTSYDMREYRDKAESGQTMRGIGLVVAAIGLLGIGISFTF